MPSQIAMSNIVDAAINGVVGAQREYEEWTGGDWLWTAPEYLITTSIAREISNIDGSKFITLENGAYDAIEDAGAIGKGRLHSAIRKDGKVDILLWWADGSPRAIIEVKNQIYYSGQYKDDIERIDKFLTRKPNENTFQFGAFVFYDSAADGKRKTGKQKVEEKIKNVYENTKSLLKGNLDVKQYKSDIYEEEDSAWAASCLLIKPKRPS